MSHPKMGELATCNQCGKEIEYVGPHWQHVAFNYRHMAKPIVPMAGWNTYPGTTVILAGNGVGVEVVHGGAR